MPRSSIARCWHSWLADLLWPTIPAYTPHYGSWLNRIEAQFKALRYFTLDGTDHPDHATQARLIRRYIAWRNGHADDTKLRAVLTTANVA